MLNTSLTELDLGRKHMLKEDGSRKNLKQALTLSILSLTIVSSFASDNYFSDKGLIAIGEAMKINTSLTTLDLSSDVQ